MIERRDERKTALRCELGSELFALRRLRIIGNDVGTVAPCGRKLHRRCVLGHDDRGGQTSQATGERDGLRMIAR